MILCFDTNTEMDYLSHNDPLYDIILSSKSVMCLELLLWVYLFLGLKLHLSLTIKFSQPTINYDLISEQS